MICVTVVHPKKSIWTSTNDFFNPENEFGLCDGREGCEKGNFNGHYRKQMSRNAIRVKSLRFSLLPRNGKRLLVRFFTLPLVDNDGEVHPGLE